MNLLSDLGTAVNDVKNAFKPAATPPPATAPRLTSDQFALKIKRQYPTYGSIDNHTLTTKVLQKYPVYSSKVDASTIKPPTTMSTVNNFIEALPGAAAQTLLGTPARLAASVAEIPQTIAKGKATGGTYSIPGIKPFQSIQTQEQNRINQGMGPVKAATLASVNAIGSGIDTAGILDTLQGLGSSKVAQATAKATEDSLNAIQETISPKITSKETQSIIDEGRLTRGKQTTLWGKQPDIVTQSESVQNSAKTISRVIPKAASMDDAQLTTAINSKIGDISTTLKPAMQSAPVDTQSISKAQSAWSSMKAEQADTPEFLDNQAGNTAFQSKFENYLKKAVDGKTLDDVWETRQAYDASVPDSIKKATSSSPPQYQVRKTMWLQNRAILNSMINDDSKGLGATSRQAFSDMSDMYDAKQNILSKAKIDTEGKPGILPRTKADWLKWGAGAGATLVGGDYFLKKLGL